MPVPDSGALVAEPDGVLGVAGELRVGQVEQKRIAGLIIGKESMSAVTLALVGAGLRGQSYARHAVAAGTGRVIAIAEPDPYRREAAAAEFGVSPDQVYADWTDLAAAGRLADAVIVATQDQMHTEPAVRMADLGYHILLEKPMATSEDDAIRIADAAQRNKIMLAVCHVLRYTPYTQTLKRLLDEKRIGRLVNVQHL
jgi:predicted dehydrogenase